jgi:hypothetical protein
MEQNWKVRSSADEEANRMTNLISNLSTTRIVMRTLLLQRDLACQGTYMDGGKRVHKNSKDISSLL